MRPKALRLWFVPFIILALLVPLVTLSAAPNNQAPQGADPAIVPDGITMAPQTAEMMAVHKWTKAEMAAAIPYPLPEASAKDLAAFGPAASAPAGEPGAVAGGLPLSAKAQEMLGTVNDTSLLSGVGLMGYTYPGPFTRWLVTNVTQQTRYPFSTVGKVYFRQRVGNSSTILNYVASAESIGNYALLTAGHVVHNGNNSSTGWSTAITFVPSMNGAVRPYGTWSGLATYVMTAWYNSRQLGRDWGAIGLYTLGGLRISQRVGNLGFAWNWTRQLDWVEVGYPAAAPFNGTQMWAVNSSFAYQDNVRVPPTMGVGNDMTGGCSGGPWIWKFGSNNYLNGVNSYRYTNPNHPLEMFSPYADDLINNLRLSAVAWHP